MFSALNGPIGHGLMLANGQVLQSLKCTVYGASGSQVPPTNLRSLEKHPADPSKVLVLAQRPTWCSTRA